MFRHFQSPDFWILLLSIFRGILLTFLREIISHRSLICRVQTPKSQFLNTPPRGFFFRENVHGNFPHCFLRVIRFATFLSNSTVSKVPVSESSSWIEFFREIVQGNFPHSFFTWNRFTTFFKLNAIQSPGFWIFVTWIFSWKSSR